MFAVSLSPNLLSAISGDHIAVSGEVAVINLRLHSRKGCDIFAGEMSELILRNVTKSFDGRLVVDACNLTVSHGEFLVLLGPSGCGKSTLLRMIAGLETVCGGDILIDNQSVTDLPPRERDVAMVFQNYALYPHMTVFDNIAFPLRMRRQARGQIRRTVEEAAGLLGLTDMLARKPKTLSGGQRQRVALGRALVRKPKLFLFDEPLSNLDAKLRVSMRSEILRIMRSLKATVVYVTHDQEEALTMGDRIAVIHDHVIQQVGSPEKIYGAPANLFVARFIGMPRMNLLEVCLTDDSEPALANDTVAEGIRPPTTAPGRRLTLGFRPDDCDISPSGGIPASVESVEYVGSSRYLHCRIDNDEIVIRVDPSADIPRGSRIGIVLRPDRVHFFDSSGERIG